MGTPGKLGAQFPGAAALFVLRFSDRGHPGSVQTRARPPDRTRSAVQAAYNPPSWPETP